MFSHPILRILVFGLLFFGVQVNGWAAECIASDEATLNSHISDTSCDPITLLSGITLTSSANDLNRAVTINGGGHIVQGNNNFRLFIVNTSSGNVKINDITLTKGNSETGSEDHGCADAKTGGAICKEGAGTLTINRSTISGNKAVRGGGIYVNKDSGDVNIYNSVFNDNTGTSYGGGVYGYTGATINIVGCTITENDSKNGAGAGGGGGVYSGGATITIKNSIVLGNTSKIDRQDCYAFSGSINSNGYNIVGNGTGCPNDVDSDDSDNTTEDTDIVGGILGDIFEDGVAPTLKSDSPALDKYSCSGTDYLGTARPQNGSCDIGAHELIQGSPEIEITDASNNILTTGAALSLGAAEVGAATPPSFTLTIKNKDTATAPLTLSDSSIMTTTQPSLSSISFTSDDALPDEIAKNNSVTYTIKLSGTGTKGSYEGTFLLETNAGDFTFNLSATISDKTYTVSTSTSGSGSVSGAGSYAEGDTVNLKANASSGWKFTGWSGSGCSNSFTMPANDISCTANFTKEATDPPVVTPPPEPKYYNLQVNITGKGSFDSDMIGIPCLPKKANCTAYREGWTVELTPEPDQGYQFKSWSGDCSRSGKVEMDERKTCQLTFEKLPTFQLVTQKSGKGSGTISSEDNAINCGSTCRASYTADQTTILNATVNDDKTVFTGWACVDGRQTTEPTLEIAMSQNRTCTATFAALYSLTTYVNSDGGTVSYEDLSCGAETSPCTQNYPEGEIQLTANPDNGYVAIWGNECPAGKLNLNTDQTCSISFVPSYKLILKVLGDGFGAITSLPEGINCQTGTTICEASYIQGDVIQLVATPEFGSSFAGWTGDCANGQTTLTMDSDKICTAGFIHTGSPQFSQDIYSVTEQDGVATITVNRLEGSNGKMNVTYAMQAGTATSQYDFVNTSGVLTWADGDVEPKTFDIFINADPETEPVETVKLFLLNQTNTVLDQAELQIADTFIPANINFVRTNITATDQDNILTFAVSRSIAFSGAIQVDFVVTVGDNILTQGPLTWADGDMETKLIQIPIGAVPVGWNTLQATISNAQPDNLAILGAKNTATLTISETPTAGEVNFSNSEFSTQEGRRALIEVQRSGDNDTVASVDFILLDGTATPTTDYIATNGTLNWAKNEGGSKPIYINALRDSVVEETETINIQLSNPIGTKLGTTSTAVLQILDVTATPSTDSDGNPISPPIEQPVLPPEPSLGVVEFAQTEYVVNEDAGSVIVKIVRTPDTSGTINVQVSSQDSSATAGYDYAALNQQLRWINQDTTAREIQIGLLDNATVDGTRTFILELSNTGQIDTVGERATALVTILDNDSSQIHFEADNYSVNEDGREVVLTVARSGNGLDAAAIGYRTNSQGTAKVGKDFTKTSGRVDWQAGDTRSQNITIPIINDNAVEKDETFTVALYMVDGLTQTVSPSSAIVTIKDDDSKRTEPVVNPDSGNTLINGQVSNREQPIGEDGKTTFINPNGSITNSTIKGDIENEGVLIDVTLAEGATVTGGIIRGSVNGSLEKPAVLKGVTIESGTVLNNVIIGNGSIVADDVILGENVKFTENTVIPAINLDKLTGRITPIDTGVVGSVGGSATGFFAIFAVNLRTDVITNPAIDGILGSINGLQEFIDHGVAMEQEPNYGMLVLKYNGIVYPLLPVSLRQVLPEQLRNSKPYVGLYVEHNGNVEFITHTGRRINSVPVVYAPEQFLPALDNLGLGQAVMDATGNIYIPATDSEYLSARASLLSPQVTDAEPGIKYINRVYLPNTTKMQFTYTDNEGILRQQLIYPAPVDNAALQALTAQVDIYMDGRVEAKNAAGQIEYNGLLGYNIYQAVAEPSDTISIQEIEDVNVDGLLDYRLIYPNGDAQVLYRMQ
jgi:hypothetical protein